MRSTVLTHPNATWTEIADTRVPATLPTDAHAAAALEQGGAAVMDLSWAAGIRLLGDDTQRFLNSMLTADFRSMKPGAGAHSAITDNKGRIQGLLDGYLLQPGVGLLILDGTDADWALERLDMYIIMDPIELTDLRTTHTVLHVAGPAAESLIAQIGLAARDDAATEHGANVVLRCDRVGQGIDVLVPNDQAASVWDQLVAAGAVPAGFAVYESLRIQRGLPRWPVDMGERAFIHEMGLRDRVCSFTKGCYIGQEVINRMDTMGRVNKRLLGLASDGPLRAGDAVFVDDTQVGVVGSVAKRGDGSVALSILRKAAWEPGLTVSIQSGDRLGSATVVSLPMTEVTV